MCPLYDLAFRREFIFALKRESLAVRKFNILMCMFGFLNLISFINKNKSSMFVQRVTGPT